MVSFQGSVNRYPAPAVAGDFASDNPRQAMVAGEAALVTGSDGVTLGLFAWADDAGVVTNAKPGSGVARLGFASREGQGAAFIATWLQGYSMLMPAGLGITLHTDADVWALNTVGAATTGQKVFASNTNGSIQPGTAGTPISGYTETNYFYLSDAAVGEIAMIGTGG